MEEKNKLLQMEQMKHEIEMLLNDIERNVEAGNYNQAAKQLLVITGSMSKFPARLWNRNPRVFWNRACVHLRLNNTDDMIMNYDRLKDDGDYKKALNLSRFVGGEIYKKYHKVEKAVKDVSLYSEAFIEDAAKNYEEKQEELKTLEEKNQELKATLIEDGVVSQTEILAEVPSEENDKTATAEKSQEIVQAEEEKETQVEENTEVQTQEENDEQPDENQPETDEIQSGTEEEQKEETEVDLSSFEIDGAVLVKYLGGNEEGELQTAVNVPETVTEIGQGAFDGCEFVSTIVISDSVQKISENAFANCKNLTTVSMPNSVTEIASGAFSNCVNLEKIKISEGVTTLYNATFENCEKLVEVDLPDSLVEIKAGAFTNCASMDAIILPDGLELVESGAFKGCPMAFVFMPNRCKYVKRGKNRTFSKSCLVIKRRVKRKKK